MVARRQARDRGGQRRLPRRLSRRVERGSRGSGRSSRVITPVVTRNATTVLRPGRWLSDPAGPTPSLSVHKPLEFPLIEEDAAAVLALLHDHLAALVRAHAPAALRAHQFTHGCHRTTPPSVRLAIGLGAQAATDVMA